MKGQSDQHVQDGRRTRTTALSLSLHYLGWMAGALLCLTVVAAVQSPLSACTVLTGPAVSPVEELIARSPVIALATTESFRTFTEEHDFFGSRSVRIQKAEYTFRTLELLKGTAPSVFSMVFIYPAKHVGSAPDEDFDGHRKPGSRTFVPGPCEVSADFAVGKRYLIFTGVPYHRSSFEQILSDDDLWLAEVRRLIGGRQ